MLSHVIFVIIQVLQKSKVNLCLHNQMQSLHLATQTRSMLHFLLKSVNIKKASGLGKTPPKLAKGASNIFSVSLSQAINNTLMNGTFPDAARVPMVSTKKLMMKTKYLIMVL